LGGWYKNENRQWRRNRALDGYLDFLLAVEMVRLESEGAYLGPDCGTAEHARQHGLVREKLSDMYRAQQRAVLLAPSKVYIRMAVLGRHVGEEIAAKFTTCPKMDKSALYPALEEYTKLLIAFSEAARTDLGVDTPLRGMMPINKHSAAA
jgi:hypothetical protein